MSLFGLGLLVIASAQSSAPPPETRNDKSTIIHRVQQERSYDLSDTTILDDATRGGGHSFSVPGKGEQCHHQPEFPSSSAQGKQSPI